MSDMNGAGFKMNAFDRKLVKVGEIDLRLRQVRAGVFIVAAVISLFASTASASPVLSWMAGAAWGAFIVAIVVHRIARTRAMRLNWRIQLEKRLQNLRDLIPSSDLTWSFHTNDDVAGRSARRLIRDLDVVPAQTGAGAFASLFPFFLSTAGQNRFLEMLTSPVLMTRSMLDALGEVRRRQKAISFWEKRTVLRRKILRISAAIDQRLDTNALKQDVVIETAPPKARRWLLLVICAQVFFFGCWITAIVLEKKWIGTMGLLTWIASYSVVVRRVDLFAAYPRAMSLGRSLRVLREVSLILKRVAHLPDVELKAFAGEQNPAAVLKEIELAAGALGTRQNPILALLINFFVPWDLYWTIRFDEARRKVVNSLPSWLNALAELEAFVAFAEWNKAHGKALPEFHEGQDGTFVQAKKLAHPLLSPSRRVANDLLISKKGRCHLVTGSNMSGKSTFLRSIGLNLLLAHAGAKVVADQFRLVLLRVESSMRPADSLSDGFSSFYSEVSDLVEIVGLAENEGSVFYMIDEIFRGTNNRERRMGAEAVIRALAKTTAMGLVTTHDLDLASLEGGVDGLENHHFRDDVTDGKMTFSYEYRHGPCPSTNALKVMRTAGLPVPDSAL